ncbi:MAG TPA: hypothetical protein VED84_08775 [Acidimicrobiales bacterium]|nr:hypothetical protein [Acidimicrobiales bacterium]
MRALDMRMPKRRRRLAGVGVLGALVIGLGWFLAPSASGAAGLPTESDAGPSGEATLVAVSCASARWCVAVGYSGLDTLIESWNGSGWTVSPSPDRGATSSLGGVACVSTRWCLAVGSYKDRAGVSRALVEIWNGSSWSIGASPGLRAGAVSLSGVSCVSARLCAAVGGAGTGSLMESWNGSTWTAVATQTPSGRGNLNGVSCSSPGSCVAVGNDGGRTLVASWNGTRWSTVPSPTPGRWGGLAGVSCPSARSCLAVGNYSTGTGSGSSTPPGTLVESYNGTTWSVVPDPTPPVALLFAVSCLSASFCQAVGEYPDTSGSFRALIQHWNGHAWSVEPNPSPPVAYLYGVSCVSARLCQAVGEFAPSTSGARSYRALIESWNGRAWST